MATAKRRRKARTEMPREDDETRVIAAAMNLAQTRGWARTSLAEIGDAAGLALPALYDRFPSKVAVLRALMRRTDVAMLTPPPDREGGVRDRLFDLYMRRFDALKPYKAGLAAVSADLASDPPAAACLGIALYASMSRLADAAGIGTGGLLGPLRIKALMAIYILVARTWLADEGDDGAKTMAALDRALKRAEMLAASLTRLGGRSVHPGG